MSDKGALCLVCGHFTPPQAEAGSNPERIGGPGQPYTYHRACAMLALDEARRESDELADEIIWLEAALGGQNR